MKILLFSDLHLGKKEASDIFFLEDIKFIMYMSAVASLEGVDLVLFLGDFFEKRAHYHPKTLIYARYILDEINKLNIPFFFILGNHDMFQNNSKEFTNYDMFDGLFKNIYFIKYPQTLEIKQYKFLLLPWTIESEIEIVKKMIRENNVIFGHIEINDFPLYKIDSVFSSKDFEDKKVFSGHFHNPSRYENLLYIGSPYAFDFSHTSDKYGMWILEIDKNKIFEKFVEYKGFRYKKIISGVRYDFNNGNTYMVRIKAKNEKEMKELSKIIENNSNVHLLGYEITNNEETKVEETQEFTFEEIQNAQEYIKKIIDLIVKEEKQANRLKEKIEKIGEVL